MGIFSSKSKSTSKTTNNTTNTYTDNSRTTSGTVGDMSEGNLIASGNISTVGYTAKETQSIIDTSLDAILKTVDGIKDVTGKAITQVQSAYSGANDSILQSQSETKTLLNSLQPFALYTALAAAIYFVWGKK